MILYQNEEATTSSNQCNMLPNQRRELVLLTSGHALCTKHINTVTFCWRDLGSIIMLILFFMQECRIWIQLFQKHENDYFWRCVKLAVYVDQYSSQRLLVHSGVFFYMNDITLMGPLMRKISQSSRMLSQNLIA